MPPYAIAAAVRISQRMVDEGALFEPGPLLSLASLVREYFTGIDHNDFLVVEAAEESLRIAVDAPDKIVDAIRLVGAEHLPTPDWQEHVLAAVAPPPAAAVEQPSPTGPLRRLWRWLMGGWS